MHQGHGGEHSGFDQELVRGEPPALIHRAQKRREKAVEIAEGGGGGYRGGGGGGGLKPVVGGDAAESNAGGAEAVECDGHEVEEAARGESGGGPESHAVEAVGNEQLEVGDEEELEGVADVEGGDQGEDLPLNNNLRAGELRPVFSSRRCTGARTESVRFRSVGVAADCTEGSPALASATSAYM